MNRQMITKINPQAIFLDDAFDQAIVGVGNDADGDLVAVYSQKKCINILGVDGIDNEDFDFLWATFIEKSRGKGAPVIFTELWEVNEH
jgi:hypothetical protein